MNTWILTVTLMLMCWVPWLTLYILLALIYKFRKGRSGWVEAARHPGTESQLSVTTLLNCLALFEY